MRKVVDRLGFILQTIHIYYDIEEERNLGLEFQNDAKIVPIRLVAKKQMLHSSNICCYYILSFFYSRERSRLILILYLTTTKHIVSR